MSSQVTWNGTTYIIPATGETGWGTQVSNFLLDLGNNATTLNTSQALSNKTIKLVAGTSNSPALTFTSDTASGIYQPATSQVAIATNGIQRLLVGATGTITATGTTALNGGATAPTKSQNTNTTDVATTAFVIGQSSTTTPNMDGTAAVGTYTTFARADHVHPTDTSRAPLASPALTGTPTAPTPAVDDSSTNLSTTAWFMGQAGANIPAGNGAASPGSSPRFSRMDHVHPTDTSRAPVASPTFTGTPIAPTPAADSSSAQIATTLWVMGQRADTAPLMDGTATIGISTRLARADHIHPTDGSRAALAGSATQVFAVANGTSGNQAVNYSQLAGHIGGDVNQSVSINVGQTYTASATFTAPTTGLLVVIGNWNTGGSSATNGNITYAIKVDGVNAVSATANSAAYSLSHFASVAAGTHTVALAGTPQVANTTGTFMQGSYIFIPTVD